VSPGVAARAGVGIAALALLAACSGAPADSAFVPRAAPAPAATAEEPLPPPVSPIDDTLPGLVAPNLPQRATCRIGTCMMSNPVPEDLLKMLPERGPLMIWEHRLGARARLAYPADREVEVAGVVLEGSVGLLSREDQWGGTPAKMTQWQGFYAPGGGVTLVAMDKNPARLAIVLALVTNSGDASLAAHVGRWRKSKKPFEWKQRERAMQRVDFTSLPAVSWGKGGYHARIGWEVPDAESGGAGAQGASDAARPEAPSMVVNLLRFSRDAGIAEEVHTREWECLVVLEGEGELQTSLEPVVAGGAAIPVESVAVEPGMVACIPNGMWHAYKPSGNSPLLSIQVFAPPGPALRLKPRRGEAR
jgi:mannose-6-phosphate isomerase-like protein (cupin superfamily)